MNVSLTARNRNNPLQESLERMFNPKPVEGTSPMQKNRSTRDVCYKNVATRERSRANAVISSTEHQRRAHATLLSGISSRTQIDAQGKVKHLFEITQGSATEKDPERRQAKLLKESAAKDRKRLISSGKPPKRRRTRPTTAKVDRHDIPVALNLVNEKENGEEIGTVRGGSTSRRSRLEISSRRRSQAEPWQQTLVASQKSSQQRPQSSRLESHSKQKQKSKRDLVGPSPRRRPVPPKAQVGDKQPISSGTEHHSHRLGHKGAEFEFADSRAKDGVASD